MPLDADHERQESIPVPGKLLWYFLHLTGGVEVWFQPSDSGCSAVGLGQWGRSRWHRFGSSICSEWRIENICLFCTWLPDQSFPWSVVRGTSYENRASLGSGLLPCGDAFPFFLESFQFCENVMYFSLSNFNFNEVCWSRLALFKVLVVFTRRRAWQKCEH